MSFFTGMGIPKWAVYVVGGALVLVAVGFVYWMLVRQHEEVAKENREVGRTEQRADDLVKTVERVEEANATREEIKREVDAGVGERLYAQCLRTARTPANCQRFLPQREADQR